MRLFGGDTMSLVGAPMNPTRRTGHQGGVLKQAFTVLHCNLHYVVTSRRKACSTGRGVETAVADSQIQQRHHAGTQRTCAF